MGEREFKEFEKQFNRHFNLASFMIIGIFLMSAVLMGSAVYLAFKVWG